MLYFIPFSEIKKDVFQIFSDFFAHFLQSGRRTGKQVPQQPQQIGGRPPDFEDRPAQRQEIGHAAQGDGQNGVDPHLPSLHRQRPQEQHDGGRRPEQEIQRPGQQGQAQSVTDQTQQIIQQSQSEAEPQSAGKGRSLGGNGDLHSQPSSRENRPPLSLRLSS